MIDYKKLADAIDYYKIKGYTYKEVPWVVSEDAINITLPLGKKATKCDIGCLVGSSEQSFIEAVINENLKGRFIACSPCFRNDQEDELHHKYFMKVGLFVNVYVNSASLARITEDAYRFFSKYLSVEIINTDEGYGIVDVKNKIELGSYYMKEHPLVGGWIAGTGLALPRFDYILGKQ